MGLRNLSGLRPLSLSETRLLNLPLDLLRVLNEGGPERRRVIKGPLPVAQKRGVSLDHGLNVSMTTSGESAGGLAQGVVDEVKEQVSRTTEVRLNLEEN
jgi:hypothetical protein